MKITMKIISLAAILLILTAWLSWSGFRFAVSSTSNASTSSSTLYEEKYFDRNSIMKIEIDIAKEEWEDMIANAMKEEFHEATVTVNGDVYPMVMIRPKGNSSLSTIAKSSFNEEGSLKRFSMKINFNELNEAQTMAGLTQLNLNNSFADPSFMREYLGYQIFEKMGVKVPAFCYANVYVNGEYFGLFLAVESILNPYLERNFGDSSGVLYKSVGNTLKYTGNISTDTKGLEIKNDHQNASNSDLMKFLKALNQGDNLDQCLDIDQTLRHIAVSTALINMDSYQGSFAHNYYLYEQDGKFTFLPWDLNMAFGGFNFNGDLTNFFIDEPTQGNVADRPLIAKLLEIDEYRARYHTYLQEILDKYLNKTYLQSEIKRLISLISSSVMNDPTALYTYQDFTANTSLIVTELTTKKEEVVKPSTENTDFKRERASFSQNTLPILSLAVATADSIQKQLNGEIPSTNDGKGMGTGQGPGPGQEPGGMNTNQPFPPAPPDGEWRQPPEGEMMPPMGGQRPEGGPGFPMGEGHPMGQNAASRSTSIWFLACGSVILLIVIVLLYLIPKRKWITAG